MDLRRREVDDYVTYGFLLFALLFRVGASLILSDYLIFVRGLLGLGFAFIISLFMFYTHQWGGGDSKLLLGIGAMLGLSFTLDSLFISFLVHTLFFGALYSLLWAFVLLVRHWKRASLSLQKRFGKTRYLFHVLFIGCVGSAIWSVASFSFISFTATILFGFGLILGVLFVTLKTVEQVCFIKNIPVSKLTPGDQVIEDIWKTRSKHISFLSYAQREYDATREQAKDDDLFLFLLYGLQQIFDARVAQSSAMMWIARSVEQLKEKRLQKLSKKYTVHDETIVRDVAQELYLAFPKDLFDRLRRWFKISFKKQTVFSEEYLKKVQKLLSASSVREFSRCCKKIEDVLATEKNIRQYFAHRYQFSPSEECLCSRSGFGISEEQLEKLKKKDISRVSVKEGIPFVPTFLAGFILALLFGSWYLSFFVGL
jgi:Flp pilus assembly protein protease CpaA